MKTLHRTIAVAVVALGWMSASAIAQETEKVEVQATRTVTKKVIGHTPHGVPILDLSMSYGVSLEGLDLATAAGAKEAERRVKAAATAACTEIGRRYPEATPSDSECAKQAADDAMVKVRELVAAAEKSAAAQ